MLPKRLARMALALAVAVGQDVFASGSVFVADTANDEVREYQFGLGASELGTETRTFAPIDTPVDLAYGPDGHLYVASQAPDEDDNAAILRIDPQGDSDSASLFTTFGIEGIAALAFGPGGALYAGSSRIGSNARVVKYDLAAPFGGEIVVPGPVESSLGGLAVLPNGEVLVSEKDGIRRYSGETGEFLGIFSELVTQRLAISSNGNVLATFTTTISKGLVELDRTTGAWVMAFSTAAVPSFTPDEAGNVFAVTGPHQDLDFIDRLRPPFGRRVANSLGQIGGVALVPHPVFVVNTLIDTIDASPNDGRCEDANGKCSLRAAVIEANALPGRESVVLPSGPLVLSRGPVGDDQDEDDDEALVGDLDVLGDIDLVSRGGTYVDGAQLGSLLHVLNGRCFVRGLVLRNGHMRAGEGIGLRNVGGHVDLEFVDIVDNTSDDGRAAGISNAGILHAKGCDISRNSLYDGFRGGIANYGEMLLVDTRVSQNSSNISGGILNFGSLTIRNCRLEQNGTLYGGGGAILNAGELDISGSILRKNSGGTSTQGGAILNYGNATIEDSAIVDNSAEAGGGGIYNTGTLKASNVTISGNRIDNGAGPGGGIVNEGTLELASCTVANNFTIEGAGGGIVANGSITSLRNTIVAGNSASAGGPDCAGTINSQGYNLFSDDEGCSIGGDTTGVKIGGEIGLGDLVEAPQPQVLPPIRFFLRTLVHPLLPGSLAEGTGSPADPGSGGSACAALDQRGVERPQPSDGRCDMGAYESTCGNGVLERELGEQCDDGNRLSGDCCSGTCQYDPRGTPCGGDSGACADDVCGDDLTCVHIPNTEPCDDANACTTDDRCGGGVCNPGLARNCDDGIACTADSCNATIGCIHIAVDALCVDGNDCTANVCDSQLGCLASPLSGSCADDDACTTNETCSQGACVSQPLNCSDDDLCTNDSCDPALGCKHVLGVSCAAPDACHDAGACEPETGTCVYPPTNPDLCEVAGQCELTSACDPMTGECTVTAKPDGSSCDDGNRCTVADTCEGGSCESGSPRTCAPIDACHRAGVCDTGTGVCSNPVEVDGTSCDADRNACTRDDTCHDGVCEAGAGVSCAARDACHTAGTCDPSTGLCSEPLRDCNDGDACTTDRCDATAGCLSISVEGIGAVRCIFEEPGILLAECASGDLPPKLFKLFKRAESRIGGVETKPSVRATGRLLRKMVKAIDRGRSKGRISGGCAEALTARLKGASQRAALWLKNT